MGGFNNRGIQRHFIHDAKVQQALADLRATFDNMRQIEAKAFDIIRNSNQPRPGFAAPHNQGGHHEVGAPSQPQIQAALAPSGAATLPILGRVPSQDVFADDADYVPGLSALVMRGK